MHFIFKKRETFIYTMKGNSKIEKYFYSIFFLSNSSLKWKEDLHSSNRPALARPQYDSAKSVFEFLKN